MLVEKEVKHVVVHYATETAGNPLFGVCFCFADSLARGLAGAEATRRHAVPRASRGRELSIEPFASDLTQPVKIAHAGDSRLFVVEQPGLIQIVQPDGTLLATPFLDIQERVNNSGSEQGLLGLVFEPNDPSVFYVNYTLQTTDSGRNGNTIIARYRVAAGDINVADKNSEQIVLEVEQPYPNHNAGDLAFGPDGYLYIPLGDGGSGGDPDENAQDLAELLGQNAAY